MRRLLSKFIRSEDGNYAMLTAIMMSALLGAVGLGVNAAQLYHTKSNLRQALDAAVTSTARDLTIGRIAANDARDTVERFLRMNSTGGFAAGDFDLDTLTIDPADKTVSATASADVDIAFPLFGIAKRHKVVSEAAAIYSDRKIEVAMMLDVTGSMGDRGTPLNGRRQTKLDNLKAAANDAVTDLLQRNANSGNSPRVRVALVPYAAGVNVGSLSDAIYYEGRGVPARAPMGLAELNLPVNAALKAAMNAVKLLVGDKCATERKSAEGAMDYSDASPIDAMINRDSRLQACPTAQIVPLTTNLQRLKAAIASFTPTGTTAGHIGIQWTQYVLSPKWTSFLRDIDAGGSVPAAYDDAKAKKIAILMTDGEFNTAYAGVNTAGQSNESARKSPEYSRQLCDQLKGNDVEVFTIGFMLDQDGARNTLAACASPDTAGVKHFYDASSGAELSQAFDAITANIEKVRLTN